MNMKQLSLIAATTALSSLCLAAPLGSGDSMSGAGQQSQSSDVAVFSALDRDRSGSINEEEAKLETSLSENFDTVDRNSDGEVSKNEYLARNSAIESSMEEGE